jgi:hypothetical protein
MIKKNTIQLVTIIFFYFQAVIFYGQNPQSDHEFYNVFDSIIGVGNNAIYNGIEYEKKYRTLGESHEFYFTSQFLKGNIIYDSQPYYNIYMKYDVLDDDLIVKLPNNYAGSSIIRLIKDKVKYFYIADNQFVRIENDKKNNSHDLNSGFYQLLYQSNYLVLYKKHKKSRTERSDKKYTYNVFKDITEYYLFYNKNYYVIKSQNDFVKLFPKLKSNINVFFKNNKPLYSSNYDMFLEKLTKHIDSLISKNELFNQ